MQRERIRCLMLLSALLFAGCRAPQPAVPGRCEPAPVPAPGTALIKADLSVNPEEVRTRLTNGLAKLHADGKLVPASEIAKQLSRRSCALALPPAGGSGALELPALYRQSRKSVMIVGGIFKCGRCSNMHCSTASGYMITADGVMVTNYHVVAPMKEPAGKPGEPTGAKPAVKSAAPKPEQLGFGVMDMEGRLYGVKEVLAADKATDIAIVRLDGSGFSPLALQAQPADIGSAVSIVSHPQDNFFVLSTGIVTEYVVRREMGGASSWMCVSAEYGVGSSGAPVTNLRGDVVGMVSATRTIMAGADSQHAGSSSQMVLRYCVPASLILKLITPPAKP